MPIAMGNTAAPSVPLPERAASDRSNLERAVSDRPLPEAAAIRVAVREGEFHVVALQAYAPGDAIMTIDGELSAIPCRHSVQIGRCTHIAPPAGLTRQDGHDRYLWRFLNHSCVPNAALRGRTLVALLQVTAGDEITFDYNANEYCMSAPFHCRCGHCDGGVIRGFKFLTPAQREQRGAYLSEHLRDRMHDDE